MNLDQWRALQAQEKESTQVEQPKEEVKETEETQNPSTEPVVEEKKEEVQKVKIGEEEITIDELKQGYLRQSDYTRKTQELAAKRKEMEHAVEVYERVKNDPELATAKLSIVEEKEQEINELKSKLAATELDKELTLLKVKHPDFDDVKVLNEAARLGINDLEFVYKALRDVPASAPTAQENVVDAEVLKEQVRKELLAELKAKEVPPSIVASGTSAPVANTQPTLTAREMRIADALGVSYDDYIKYK